MNLNINSPELDFDLNAIRVALESYRTANSTVGIERYDEPQFKSIKDALIFGTDGIVPTTRMLRNIISFWNQIQARPDNIPFFGGNLLGTDNIRFYSADRDNWFDNVLEIDEEYLKEAIHSLPVINTDWVVTSDIFNMSCVWIISAIMIKFGDRDKLAREAMLCVLDLFQFRFLTSIYAHYFKRPVDESAATATYASLTLKFKIRQLGTWGAVIRDRSESILDKDSIHYKTFKDMGPDESILYVITDVSTRTRKTIKDQYAVLDKVRANNLRVQSNSLTMELDGEMIIKDKVNTYSVARNYLLDVSGNPTSFIRNELVDVVLDMMPTVSEQAFTDLLKVISSLPTGKERDSIEWTMNETLLISFDLITEERIKFTDLTQILRKMRAQFMVSKSPGENLLEIRERLEKFAAKYSKLHSQAALASVRTSIMLYFLLRGLTYNQYR